MFVMLSPIFVANTKIIFGYNFKDPFIYLNFERRLHFGQIEIFNSEMQSDQLRINSRKESISIARLYKRVVFIWRRIKLSQTSRKTIHKTVTSSSCC